MTISAVDQVAVWAIDHCLLSLKAKIVFQLLADKDAIYNIHATEAIPRQLGNTLNLEAVRAAILELWEKGYLIIAFVPRYPKGTCFS